MSELIQYWNRFKTETIYLWEDQEELYVCAVAGKGYFAKFKGGKEYKISSSSHIVVRAIHAKREVSKEEYENA